MERTDRAGRYVVAVLLAVLALSASCRDAENDGDLDAGSASDTDSDTDNWDDCLPGDPTCMTLCDPVGTVTSEPAGVAAELAAICAAAGDPVSSTEAAFVDLSEGWPASGHIVIPDDILGRVEDLPTISFATEFGATGDPTAEITDLEVVADGYSFHVALSAAVDLPDCGDAYFWGIIATVRLAVDCTGVLADGGVADASPGDGGTGDQVNVASSTHLWSCYLDEHAYDSDWFSSGEECPYFCEGYWYDPCD